MNYRGSTCKFRNARSAFRNLHVDPLSSYLHEKQTSRIQSLYLYFIKIVPFWLRNIRFLIQNTWSLFYGCHYSSLHRLMSLHRKLDVKFFLMFIVAENTRSVNIIKWTNGLNIPHRKNFVYNVIFFINTHNNGICIITFVYMNASKQSAFDVAADQLNIVHCIAHSSVLLNTHTLLPAIGTTDVIGNTDNKQVKRNMSKYFQRMFMLFSLSFGYLFYDTYSYFL